MTDKTVVVIGGGVAGLSAALELARFNIQVDVVEKADFAGGHAIRYACKATDQCVKCGACVVEEKLEQALADARIRILTGCRIENISNNGRFGFELTRKARYIDPEKCTACGACWQECPQPGALVRGVSGSHVPFYALNEKSCLYVADQSCTRCQEACPEKAIALDARAAELTVEADAVILATGFETFDPRSKPYGYGRYPNVVTNLELDEIVRRQGGALKPSDGRPAQRIGFIQCVGSRDAKVNHLWCSRICCGTSLRMARLIRSRAPETEVTFFYVDVQTFGRDFEPFYSQVTEEVRMIRAIPGDILQMQDGQLKVTVVNSQTHETVEELFDLIVLAVGLQPCQQNQELIGRMNLKTDVGGFVVPQAGAAGAATPAGVFAAGTVTGPMGIAESVASAGQAAWHTLRYLQKREADH